MEEQLHLNTVFGYNWLDDDAPDIPEEDTPVTDSPRHMDQFNHVAQTTFDDKYRIRVFESTRVM